MYSSFKIFNRIVSLVCLFGYDAMLLYWYKGLYPGRAVKLCNKLRKGGVVVIKLVQWVSEFSNLYISEEYTTQFKLLQENCYVHPLHETLTRLPENVKSKLQFDETPFASGSLGQVYKATYDGVACILKSKHPEYVTHLSSDLIIIRWIHNMMDINLINIPKYIESLQIQNNFITEVAHLRRISRNFRNWKKWVTVPVVLSYDTNYILETEIIGTKVIDISAKVLLARVFLKMLFVDRFIHADLHPGNIIQTKDNKIGLIDFGLCIEINEGEQDVIINLFKAVINGDKPGIYQTLQPFTPILLHIDHVFNNDINIFIKIAQQQSKSSFFDNLPQMLQILNRCQVTHNSNIFYIMLNYNLLIPNGETFFKDATQTIISNWEIMQHFGYSIQPMLDHYDLY